MTDAELRSVLQERIACVRTHVAQACSRVGRDPATVAWVAVTKTVSARVAALSYDLGLADLGESRPQELWRKAAALPQARWHLIGHLQRNKIDRTVPFTTLIHSVDSERVLLALDAFGRARDQAVSVLLQVNCSREANKGGFAPNAMLSLADKLMSLPGVTVVGLMTMAAFSENAETARPVFAELYQLREELRVRSRLELPHLSMGMSNDYVIAVEEGATLIRLGSTLFDGLTAE